MGGKPSRAAKSGAGSSASATSALGRAASDLEDCGPETTAGTRKERELLQACKEGKVARAKHLLSTGVNVNFGATLTNVSTPLHEAVKARNLELVELLLSKGALVDSTDNQRMTPLHLACRRPNAAILRALLGGKNVAGALDMQDRGGRTALFYLAAKKEGEMYTILLASGADDTVTDASGNSARTEAIKAGIVDV